MHPDDPSRPKPPVSAALASRADVQRALEAGFSLEEVAYMLDMPTGALVDGEDRGLHGAGIERKPA